MGNGTFTAFTTKSRTNDIHKMPPPAKEPEDKFVDIVLGARAGATEVVIIRGRTRRSGGQSSQGRARDARESAARGSGPRDARKRGRNHDQARCLLSNKGSVRRRDCCACGVQMGRGGKAKTQTRGNQGVSTALAKTNTFT